MDDVRRWRDTAHPEKAAATAGGREAFEAEAMAGTLRPIPDPQAEMERLARQRMVPGQPATGPHREWAIRHPDGQVTVSATGPAFGNRQWADGERAELDRLCPHCAGGRHVLMVRDVPGWTEDA